MAKTTFAVRIDSKLAELIRSFCNSHGIKQNFFVEKALDFKKQRADEKKAISFEEYLHLRKSVSA